MSHETDRSIVVRNIAIGSTIVVAIVALVFLWNWKRDSGGAGPPIDRGVGEPAAPLEVEGDSSAAKVGLDGAQDDLARRWTAALGQPPEWPGDFSAPGNCEQVELELARVCTALDARAAASGMRDLGGACALMDRVIAELAAAPPDLSSELRSYEAMLGNVFHLFRALGRERMQVLRRVLGEERDLAEPLAMALYRWSISREACSESAPTRLRVQSMYAYAGFLFQTMGGQAYLRRRSPKTEALACFYALQVLDHAIEGGYNPQGFDPRTEIPRCRALVESQPLVFSDRYVAMLDEMSRAWESRAAQGR
jgi:hypothetical protein